MMNNEPKNNAKLAELLKIQAEARKIQFETVGEYVRMGNYFPTEVSNSADYSPAGGHIPVITKPDLFLPA